MFLDAAAWLLTINFSFLISQMLWINKILIFSNWMVKSRVYVRDPKCRRLNRDNEKNYVLFLKMK